MPLILIKKYIISNDKINMEKIVFSLTCIIEMLILRVSAQLLLTQALFTGVNRVRVIFSNRFRNAVDFPGSSIFLNYTKEEQ